MTDDKPPEAGWLHYRLAVGFCSALVMCGVLLFVLLAWAISGAPGAWLYEFVFSKWGAVIVLGTFTFGFAAGSERAANFFAILWGTHQIWSEMEEWLYEHETASRVLAAAFVVLVVGSFWYAFR